MKREPDGGRPLSSQPLSSQPLSSQGDFDSPWKTLLERHFRAFLEWFFPNIAADIDWARGHEFLDKELQKIARRAKEKRRYADKLAKVWRRDGIET